MATNISREEKLALRRAKLEELKQKKEMLRLPAPVITIKKRAAKRTPVEKSKKRRVFTEENESVVNLPKVFTPPTFQQMANTEEDEFENYINSISTVEEESAAVLPDEESSDEEDNEDNDDVLSLKIAKLNQEKLLAVPTRSLYGGVEKEFYQELENVSQLGDAEVDLIRCAQGEMRLEGEDPPKPVVLWIDLGLPPNLVHTIAKLGYTEPSPIQSQALPALLSGRDVVGIAKTGSGKTIAFVLPMLRHIQAQPPLQPGEGPMALVLTPTRELALQIYKQISHFLGFTAVCCYGGANIEPQIATLKRGAEIIVGTPGRVIDLLAANSGRVTNLQRCSYVVVDEADRMFDMGFEPQVSKIFAQITRPDHQTVLFSATFPKKMALLARKVIVHRPLRIIVGEISTVANEIEQEVQLCSNDEGKFDNLVKILVLFLDTNLGKVLIFVEKQTMADTLLVRLLLEKFAAVAIHGGKDQIDRKHAIKEFSDGDSGINVLIATSIAARGLDVKNLNLVINYDPAGHLEDYVHRVGRTGRAGAKGRAITLVTHDQERPIADLARAFRASGKKLPLELEEINRKFLAKVKLGETKYSFGFGGRGLDNLDEQRQLERAIQQRNYGEEDKTPTPSSLHALLPDFSINPGLAPETLSSGTSGFHSRVVINDLPQATRWHIVGRDSLTKIIDSTGAVITTKGQFYPSQRDAPIWPPAKFERDMKPPPKLYLLIEGLTEVVVGQANTMIRERMVEGLDMAVIDEKSASGKKYTV